VDNVHNISRNVGDGVSSQAAASLLVACLAAWPITLGTWCKTAGSTSIWAYYWCSAIGIGLSNRKLKSALKCTV